MTHSEDKTLAIQTIVLVDDNIPLTMAWEMAAEESGVNLCIYHDPISLLNEIERFGKETTFYIDIILGDESGISISKSLFEKGFKKLYLITGKREIDYPKNVNWVLGILGKDVPF